MSNKAGDFIHIQRGTVHAFRNDRQSPVKMLVTYSPAGLEVLFQRVFEPVDDRRASPPPWTEAAFARLKAIEAQYGLETLLPDGSGVSGQGGE